MSLGSEDKTACAYQCTLLVYGIERKAMMVGERMTLEQARKHLEMHFGAKRVTGVWPVTTTKQ